MDKLLFEKELYEDFKKNELKLGLSLCEDPSFDKLYDLRDQMYSYFYPLGCTGKSLQDVVNIFQELNYSEKDNGELSLIIGYHDIGSAGSISKYGPTNVPVQSSIIVMKGFYTQLDNQNVVDTILHHSSGQQ